MQLLDDEIVKILDDLARSPDIYSFWQIIKSEYETYGFKDELTDAERLTEYNWIMEQLRKSMNMKKAELGKMQNETAKGFYETLVRQIDQKRFETSGDRKDFVFRSLRNALWSRTAEEFRMLAVTRDEMQDDTIDWRE